MMGSPILGRAWLKSRPIECDSADSVIQLAELSRIRQSRSSTIFASDYTSSPGFSGPSWEREVPLELQSRPTANQEASAPRAAERSGDLVIGLINNMPDSALEGTEAQFRGLLNSAA